MDLCKEALKAIYAALGELRIVWCLPTRDGEGLMDWMEHPPEEKKEIATKIQKVINEIEKECAVSSNLIKIAILARYLLYLFPFFSSSLKDIINDGKEEAYFILKYRRKEWLRKIRDLKDELIRLKIIWRSEEEREKHELQEYERIWQRMLEAKQGELGLKESRKFLHI